MVTKEQVKAAKEAFINYEPAGDFYQFEERMRDALEAADDAAWKKIEDASDEDKKMNVQVYGPRASGGYYIETCKYFETAGKWPVVFMQDYGEPTHFRPLPTPPKEQTR